jgi:6-phosphogluconolactonase
MINYQRFDDAEQVVHALAETLREMSRKNRKMHISLSGGTTPKLLFKALAQPPYRDSITWQNLHFWWGDERCVAPADPESNFGEAERLLFEKISIPDENIHRIHGEEDPQKEVKRFAAEMKQCIPQQHDLPTFDWILLGMGTDGHTASLFPQQTDFNDAALAVIARHPESGQLRISKTAKLLANAQRITYLVLGASKAAILKQIQQQPADELDYPAAKIKSTHGQTEWYLDSHAATMLSQGVNNES